LAIYLYQVQKGNTISEHCNVQCARSVVTVLKQKPKLPFSDRQALILVGLVLYLPSASVFSVFMVLLKLHNF